MTYRVGRIAAAALLSVALCAAPAYADDAHTTPTETPHGAEWGQMGDPLPEGMEHLDHDRQQAELEAESPQHADKAPGEDEDAILSDLEGHVGSDEPDVIIEYEAEDSTEGVAVGDETRAAKSTDPEPQPTRRAAQSAPSLPSTGV